MDELAMRIALFYEGGLVDEEGRRDLEEMARVLTAVCGFSRDDAHVATLITHVAAALRRVRDGEEVSPIPDDVLDEILTGPMSLEAAGVQGALLGAMHTALPKVEQDYVLAHVGGLLAARQGV